MARDTYLFTSESVSEGHPDKMADRISDAILDHALALDPHAKVACETFLANALVVIAGEFRFHPPALYTDFEQAIPGLVRQTIRDIGYDGNFPGIDPDRCEIRLQLNRQSDDIHQGVARDDGIIGAGDQGLMFGYATDETPERIPLPLLLAHRLVKRQADLRNSGQWPELKPDAKSQVTVRYCDDVPVNVETVVFSTQHNVDIDQEQLRRIVKERIIDVVVPEGMRSATCKLLINPTGRFVVGGPRGDTGLTGRKIIVDTYGGRCPHGGGAFSGKDPTKVDRSGAYMARLVAKTVVDAEIARRCTVQLAYAIGVADPVSVHVDLHGTGVVDTSRVEDAVCRTFDLTPAGIIAALDLCRPIYQATSVYGHFGRQGDGFPWERTDRVAAMREQCGLPGHDKRRFCLKARGINLREVSDGQD